MKASISKYLSVLLFFFILLNCKSTKLKDNNFDTFLDQIITNEKKINYIGIFLIKNCDHEIIFSVNSMLYNEGLKDYKAYEYKGIPVFYFLEGIDSNNQYARNFFDSKLRGTKIELTKFEKKNQSQVNGRFAYFNNEMFIDNNARRVEFLNKECK